MPAASAVPTGLLFGGGGKSTLDLESIQKLIDHANDVADNDMKQVTKVAQDVKRIRAQLDQNFSDLRSKLEPACKKYSKARIDLLVGDPETNRKAVSQDCLKAQGLLFTMLSIGQKADGCLDTCSLKPEDSDSACDSSGCHGKLRTKKDLEDVIGGPTWRKRHQEILEACGKWPYEFKILPPAGLEGEEEEEVAEACMGELSLAASCALRWQDGINVRTSVSRRRTRQTAVSFL
ncbi:unnamed protein product [Effrenium voratum]|nr:unnamed protein product [Effrenium voratum]CAJ1422823.1 unnamed protein product [Effrenium voratum]|mmetsp:Transcript_1289/g.2995  ORF Transcript_1289/g.2995 Transcript_1289/m.2995 type:complete len:234 (-) Transcript_1289:10-711(-)